MVPPFPEGVLFWLPELCGWLPVPVGRRMVLPLWLPDPELRMISPMARLPALPPS
jgi:hypothetical protein